MMAFSPQPHTSRPPLSLVAFESMPCGCVAGVYYMRPTFVELERVEAKGPHCVYYGHRAGQVMRVGLPCDLADD